MWDACQGGGVVEGEQG
jgi:phosphoribosylpyrophosphate synthetase